MKPHPALAVPLVNAGRRQRALRNAWEKPKHVEFIYQYEALRSRGLKDKKKQTVLVIKGRKVGGRSQRPFSLYSIPSLCTLW